MSEAINGAIAEIHRAFGPDVEQEEPAEELSLDELLEPSTAGAVDVVALASGPKREGDDEVIAGFGSRGQVIGLLAEEGEGKTLLAEQLCREVARGESVLGTFPLGALRPQRVLFVDTEMGADEFVRRCADLDARGLEVPAGRMFYLEAIGTDVADQADRNRLDSEIARVGADMLWIDTGAGLVADPNDPRAVRVLFDWLAGRFREGLLLAGLTLHPRKRAQGEFGRRFDDLVGSREFKGRLSRVLYFERDRIAAFKDRGGGLRARWPTRSGGRYPEATLERPGLADPSARPFRIVVTPAEDEPDVAELEAKALELVRTRPDELTKTTLAEHLGGNRKRALSIVADLLRRGCIGPDRPRARLAGAQGECS